jgi:hypothetical protein
MNAVQIARTTTHRVERTRCRSSRRMTVRTPRALSDQVPVPPPGPAAAAVSGSGGPVVITSLIAGPP